MARHFDVGVLFKAKSRRKAEAARRGAKQYDAICEAEAEKHGLKCGDRLRAAGVEYVFSRVCEIVDGGKPVVLAYRLKKNGTTYAEATRLERWERV